jgi:hypothetical protein
MLNGWKIKDNSGIERPKLFCPQCDRCMYTKEDVQSRDTRGICSLCIKDQPESENRHDVIQMIIEDND